MATTHMEKNIRTGAKSVQGLSVGAVYFFDPEQAKDDYAKQGVSDRDAIAIGEHLDAEAGGDQSTLRSMVSANGRVKSPYSGKWFSVKADGSGRVWILND